MVTVTVQTEALDFPVKFGFETRPEADEFERQVRMFGLHLNVSGTSIEGEDGDQTLKPTPLQVGSSVYSGA